MSTSPAKKAKASPKKKAVPAHPTYQAMIKGAITALKERKGSSKAAIYKYILANYKVGDNAIAVNAHLRMALRRGVKSGFLTQVKGQGASGSFRLADKTAVKKVKSPRAKKPAAAKPKKPAAAAAAAADADSGDDSAPDSPKPAAPTPKKRASPKKKAVAAKKPKAAAKSPAKKAKSPAKKAKSPAKKSPAKKAKKSPKKKAAAKK